MIFSLMWSNNLKNYNPMKMSKIGLIISREYSSRVKKKSFILLTILGPLLMVVFIFVALYLGQQEEGKVNNEFTL